MKKLIVEAPINSLSFGNVTFNLLKELFDKGVEIGYFPIGNVDLKAFKLDESFQKNLKESYEKRYDFLADKVPSFKLWHLNGGQDRKSKNQHLYTFYECSNPTKAEISCCKSQEKTFFSSTYSMNKFAELGCSNVEFLPLGFDTSFKPTGRKYLEGVVHFGLMGKFEKRKHTGEIIRAWLKKYGNDNRYQLTCCITNPFLKQEQMDQIIKNLLDNKRYTNINFLPYLNTNEEVNELLNAIDVDLTGLSGGEGWNLPSFNATCLGKWSIILNETSHKDWATNNNSILIESNGTMPCYDGHFFTENSEYNHGFFYTWNEDDVISAMQLAEKKVNSKNIEGIKLGETMTYSKTVDQIIQSFFG